MYCGQKINSLYLYSVFKYSCHLQMTYVTTFWLIFSSLTWTKLYPACYYWHAVIISVSKSIACRCLIVQVRKQIGLVDKTIGQLLTGLEDMKLNDSVNIIFLSDHGTCSFYCNSLVSFSPQELWIYYSLRSVYSCNSLRFLTTTFSC